MSRRSRSPARSFAEPVRRREDRSILRAPVHCGIERRDRSRRRARRARRSAVRAISPWPGRKARIEPFSSGQRRADRARDLVFDPLVRIATQAATKVAGLDGVGARPCDSITGAFAKQPRHARAVECRGHDEEPQVRPQRRRVERQRQPRGRRRASARGTRRRGSRRCRRGRDHRGSCAPARPR